MGAVVQFDYGAWIARYPEFSSAVPTALFTGAINENTLTVSAVQSGSIVVGNPISGPTGLQPGTYITSFTSGTPGGIGVYQVNYLQSAPSQAMQAVTPLVSAAQAAAFFAEAGDFQANDGSGPIVDATQALSLMNMLVAHIAQLNTGSQSAPASPLVGRISQATEGSVSVSTDNLNLPAAAAFFAQTRYGLSWWQATAQYRTFRYRTNPKVFGPVPWSRGYSARRFF